MLTSPYVLTESLMMLEHAQNRYEDLFQFAPDAYLITDLGGTVQECNQAAACLLGLASKHVFGKPLLTFVHDQQRQMLQALINRVSQGNGTETWDFEMVTLTSIVPVSARICRTHREHSQWGGLLWIIRDVSPQIEAEHQLRATNQELEQRVAAQTSALEHALRREHNANHAKVSFLASLSHEIRTPLHALMAYTDLLAQEFHGPVTELQAKDLSRMRQGHEYILSLVSRILDFARLEHGQIALQPVAVCIPRFVRSVLELLQSKCVESEIQCLEPVGPEDAIARADNEALRQILINLVGNAIKFNRPKGTIEVSWEVTDDQVGIHVRDTGFGITGADMEIIFEPFVRVGTSRDRTGTGLGLPISRALAEAMQGTVSAYSVPEEGSLFSLWLPRLRNEHAISSIL